MSARRVETSGPDRWSSPRPTRDPARARAIYGPLEPMEPPGCLARLLARLRRRRKW
jgi:hypothetical protein